MRTPNDETRYLKIPLEDGDAHIPMVMTEEDFQLILDTLNLWKKRIVRSVPVTMTGPSRMIGEPQLAPCVEMAVPETTSDGRKRPGK